MSLVPMSQRTANDDWQFMVYEAREMLGMMLRWSGKRDTGLSDTEALALMISMEKSDFHKCQTHQKTLIQHNSCQFEILDSNINDCLKVDISDEQASHKIPYNGKEINLFTPEQFLEIEGVNSIITKSKNAAGLEQDQSLDFESNSYALVVSHGSQFYAIIADTVHI